MLENIRPVASAHNWEYDFKWSPVKNMIPPTWLYCSMLVSSCHGRSGRVQVSPADCARRYEPFYIISKAIRSLSPTSATAE